MMISLAMTRKIHPSRRCKKTRALSHELALNLLVLKQSTTKGLLTSQRSKAKSSKALKVALLLHPKSPLKTGKSVKMRRNNS